MALRKLVFERFENNTYFIHFSNLDGSDEHYFQITTDPERSFTLFSFATEVALHRFSQ